jgi:hypothetical protein
MCFNGIRKCHTHFRIISSTDLKNYFPKIRVHLVFILMWYTYSREDNSPSPKMSGIVRKSTFSLGKLRLANVVESELG